MPASALLISARTWTPSFAVPWASRLLEMWGQGSFKTLADSILYHFGEHGEEVGAENILQYLRKAEGFAQNLKRAERVFNADGSVRYIKNGRYIVKSVEGLILSFGKETI